MKLYAIDKARVKRPRYVGHVRLHQMSALRKLSFWKNITNKIRSYIII